MAIFITGTDTGVGKTLVSAWLCLHTQAGYWKPIQSGSLEGTDTQLVKALANVPTYPESYCLELPLSPHAAATAEGITINPASIRLPSTNSSLVVEGAGGLLVPLDKNWFMIDLMKQLMLPVILVARGTLGTINHTCLSIEALQSRAIPLLGVVISGEVDPSNKQAIEEYGKVEVLAELPNLQEATRLQLQEIPLPKKLSKYLEAML